MPSCAHPLILSPDNIGTGLRYANEARDLGHRMRAVGHARQLAARRDSQPLASGTVRDPFRPGGGTLDYGHRQVKTGVPVLYVGRRVLCRDCDWHSGTVVGVDVDAQTDDRACLPCPDGRGEGR